MERKRKRNSQSISSSSSSSKRIRPNSNDPRIQQIKNDFITIVNTPLNQSSSSYTTNAMINSQNQMNDVFEHKKFTQALSSWDFSILLTSDGLVYTMGANDFGQLGLGLHIKNNSEIVSPTMINPEYFDFEKVVQIYCKGHHCLVLTEKGNVFAWGNNRNAEIGLDRKSIYNKPEKIIIMDEDVKIKIIGTGYDRTLFIDTENNVYISDKKHNVANILFGNEYNNETPVQIECFDDMNYLLTVEGNLYEFEFYRKLKIKKMNNSIFGNEKIKKLYQNGSVYMVMTMSDKLFAWGSLENIFVPFHNVNIEEPIMIDPSLFDDPEDKIKDVAFCHTHVIFLTMKGQLFGMGKNQTGQLGIGKFSNDEPLTQIKSGHLDNQKIRSISCSSSMNLGFTLLTTESGRLYVCGNNKNGQLGIGNKINISMPQRVDVLSL